MNRTVFIISTFGILAAMYGGNVSGQNIWCATKDRAEYVQKVTCDEWGGQAFARRGPALKEHRRLNSLSSNFDKIWCATDLAVSNITRHACNNQKGKVFTQKSQAEAEHRRLKKGASSGSSTTSSSGNQQPSLIWCADSIAYWQTSLSACMAAGGVAHTSKRVAQDSITADSQNIDASQSLSTSSNFDSNTSSSSSGRKSEGISTMSFLFPLTVLGLILILLLMRTKRKRHGQSEEIKSSASEDGDNYKQDVGATKHPLKRKSKVRDGSSAENAVVVDNIMEEFVWIARHRPAAAMTKQQLEHIDDKPYDVLTIDDGRGEEESIYFDISKCFGKTLTDKEMEKAVKKIEKIDPNFAQNWTRKGGSFG